MKSGVISPLFPQLTRQLDLTKVKRGMFQRMEQ